METEKIKSERQAAGVNGSDTAGWDLQGTVMDHWHRMLAFLHSANIHKGK